MQVGGPSTHAVLALLLTSRVSGKDGDGCDELVLAGLGGCLEVYKVHMAPFVGPPSAAVTTSGVPVAPGERRHAEFSRWLGASCLGVLTCVAAGALDGPGRPPVLVALAGEGSAHLFRFAAAAAAGSTAGEAPAAAGDAPATPYRLHLPSRAGGPQQLVPAQTATEGVPLNSSAAAVVAGLDGDPGRDPGILLVGTRSRAVHFLRFPAPGSDGRRMVAVREPVTLPSQVVSLAASSSAGSVVALVGMESGVAVVGLGGTMRMLDLALAHPAPQWHAAVGGPAKAEPVEDLRMVVGSGGGVVAACASTGLLRVACSPDDLLPADAAGGSGPAGRSFAIRLPGHGPLSVSVRAGTAGAAQSLTVCFADGTTVLLGVRVAGCGAARTVRPPRVVAIFRPGYPVAAALAADFRVANWPAQPCLVNVTLEGEARAYVDADAGAESDLRSLDFRTYLETVYFADLPDALASGSAAAATRAEALALMRQLAGAGAGAGATVRPDEGSERVRSVARRLLRAPVSESLRRYRDSLRRAAEAAGMSPRQFRRPLRVGPDQQQPDPGTKAAAAELPAEGSRRRPSERRRSLGPTPATAPGLGSGMGTSVNAGSTAAAAAVTLGPDTVLLDVSGRPDGAAALREFAAREGLPSLAHRLAFLEAARAYRALPSDAVADRLRLASDAYKEHLGGDAARPVGANRASQMRIMSCLSALGAAQGLDGGEVDTENLDQFIDSCAVEVAQLMEAEFGARFRSSVYYSPLLLLLSSSGVKS